MNLFAPPVRLRTERALSTIAFVLMLATWVVGYAALVPPDRHAPRHAVVEARR